MPGTSEGCKKAARTNKKKYGKDWYTVIGSMGGSAPHARRPFSSDRNLARRAARISGKRRAKV